MDGPRGNNEEALLLERELQNILNRRSAAGAAQDVGAWIVSAASALLPGEETGGALTPWACKLLRIALAALFEGLHETPCVPQAVVECLRDHLQPSLRATPVQEAAGGGVRPPPGTGEQELGELIAKILTKCVVVTAAL